MIGTFSARKNSKYYFRAVNIFELCLQLHWVLMVWIIFILSPFITPWVLIQILKMVNSGNEIFMAHIPCFKSPKSIILKLPKLIHTFNIRCEKLYPPKHLWWRLNLQNQNSAFRLFFRHQYSQNISSELLKSKPLTWLSFSSFFLCFLLAGTYMTPDCKYLLYHLSAFNEFLVIVLPHYKWK